MGLWLAWDLYDVASGGSDVGDVVGALDRIEQSLKEAQDRLEEGPRMVTPQKVASFQESMLIIRRRFLDEGQAAVKRGDRWSAHVGGVSLELTPPKHHLG
ncbi:hypothetical protein ACWCXB_17475 [Streptomyces sp. NPDC001514]